MLGVLQGAAGGKQGDAVNQATDDLKAATLVVLTVAEAIRELGSVPSGHLYARLMNKLTLDQYYGVIGALKRAELVSESGYVLTWIGPKL